MDETAPVSLVIPTKDADGGRLRDSLISVSHQDSPPAEVIIVDSTDGGFPFDLDDTRCCGRGDPVAHGIEALTAAGSTFFLYEVDQSAIAFQRNVGINQASEPFVWTFDDTTVIETPNWTERAVQRLTTETDVVGVGGIPVGPVDDDPLGKAVAAATSALSLPYGGWRLTFPRQLCQNDRCFPPTMHRGDTDSVRVELNRHGRLVRDTSLRFRDDIPTTRQRRNLALGSAAGVGMMALRHLSHGVKST